MSFDTRPLATFQHDFLQAITAPDAVTASAGMRIYRDTWFFGLLDVLRTRFEVTAKALGEESFNAFARDFIHGHPLTSGDRSTYGMAFPDFLRCHGQAENVPWLGDLAAFEWAVDRAHHADDAAAAGFGALMSPDSRCDLHPSVQLLSLGHDVKSFHVAMLAADTDPALPRKIDCDLLVGRDTCDEVIWVCLAPYEVRFLTLIAEHHSLFTALDHLAPDDNDMAILQSLLARLVSHGLLISI